MWILNWSGYVFCTFLLVIYSLGKMGTTYVSGDYGDLNLYSRVMSEPPPPPGLARPTSPWCVFSQFSLFGVFTVRFLLYFNIACS